MPPRTSPAICSQVASSALSSASGWALPAGSSSISSARSRRPTRRRRRPPGGSAPNRSERRSPRGRSARSAPRARGAAGLRPNGASLPQRRPRLEYEECGPRNGLGPRAAHGMVADRLDRTGGDAVRQARSGGPSLPWPLGLDRRRPDAQDRDRTPIAKKSPPDFQSHANRANTRSWPPVALNPPVSGSQTIGMALDQRANVVGTAGHWPHQRSSTPTGGNGTRPSAACVARGQAARRARSTIRAS